MKHYLLCLFLCLTLITPAVRPAAAEELVFLTEDTFSVHDLPEDILLPSSQPGHIERLRYTTSTEEAQVKSVMVYLPYDYDASTGSYNVLYLMHAASGSPKTYLNPEEATSFQNLLDNMIAAGTLEPLIVVAATYYPPEGFTAYLPLAEQVKVAAEFPRELVTNILPAVESVYRTYANTTDAVGLQAAREHRAVAGFSLGGTATWYVFLQQMAYFRWFLPISEASWDDGEGGIDGIWNSDLSAQVLYDAVQEQSFSKEDFRLYVATGTEDEAFEIATNQMISLLAYSDMFIPGENTSCSMMIDGTHTLSAVYTYMYHILPALFAPMSPF